MATKTEEQTTISPGTAFTQVMTSAIEFGAGKVSQKLDGWIGSLNDVATGGANEVADAAGEGGGAQQQATIKGVQAGLQGKNPVWAAIKGAWSGGSVPAKAAVVAALVALGLLLVLSPVLLLFFLLGLLIVAAVAKARSAKQ